MKTIAEHENGMREVYKTKKEHGVGVECPKCKSELVNSWPGTALTTDPPRISVVCEDCGYGTSITC